MESMRLCLHPKAGSEYFSYKPCTSVLLAFVYDHNRYIYVDIGEHGSILDREALHPLTEDCRKATIDLLP